MRQRGGRMPTGLALDHNPHVPQGPFVRGFSAEVEYDEASAADAKGCPVSADAI